MKQPSVSDYAKAFYGFGAYCALKNMSAREASFLISRRVPATQPARRYNLAFWRGFKKGGEL